IAVPGDFNDTPDSDPLTPLLAQGSTCATSSPTLSSRATDAPGPSATARTRRKILPPALATRCGVGADLGRRCLPPGSLRRHERHAVSPFPEMTRRPEDAHGLLLRQPSTCRGASALVLIPALGATRPIKTTHRAAPAPRLISGRALP